MNNHESSQFYRLNNSNINLSSKEKQINFLFFKNINYRFQLRLVLSIIKIFKKN